jgi:hypothetical protein
MERKIFSRILATLIALMIVGSIFVVVSVAQSNIDAGSSTESPVEKANSGIDWGSATETPVEKAPDDEISTGEGDPDDFGK